MGFIRKYLDALFCMPFRWRAHRNAERDDWADEWFYAYVVKVYDGDTITVEVRRHGRWVLQSIRLAGIDTPELRTKNPLERDAAERARDALSQGILHRHVWLHCHGREKYGRILADVFPVSYFRTRGDPSWNQWMLDTQLACSYDGKTKTVWQQTVSVQGATGTSVD
jgi:micrococcal nuclease